MKMLYFNRMCSRKNYINKAYMVLKLTVDFNIRSSFTAHLLIKKTGDFIALSCHGI
jgi:hypothetical protein